MSPRKHGHTTRGAMSPAYRSWKGMVQRCTNPKIPQWKDYGGRGIAVCADWMDFSVFLRDMGDPPAPGLSLERVRNAEGYHPGNVKWATRQEQCRNRRSNRVLEFGNEKRTLVEWSERTGVSIFTLSKRLRAGWSVEATLTTPVRRCVRRAA